MESSLEFRPSVDSTVEESLLEDDASLPFLLRGTVTVLGEGGRQVCMVEEVELMGFFGDLIRIGRAMDRGETQFGRFDDSEGEVSFSLWRLEDGSVRLDDRKRASCVAAMPVVLASLEQCAAAFVEQALGRFPGLERSDSFNGFRRSLAPIA